MNNECYDLETMRTEVEKYFLSNRFTKIVESMHNAYFNEKYSDTLKKYCIGGKCIRAYLVWLGYYVSGGEINEFPIEASVSYELFEAGILAHDDIIDRSPIRRGIPSMYTSLGDDHIGLSRALCVGDALILLALSIIQAAKTSPDRYIAAINHQLFVFSQTIDGEMEDIDLSSTSIYSEREVMEMYNSKTSIYTIIGPLVLGGILAGASKDTQLLFQEIGQKIGVAFQIKDDIIGLFGNENEIGKSVFSDAQEGKKSILTAHFDQHASKDDKDLFYTIYGKNNISIENLQLIRNLLIQNGSYQYANDIFQDYCQEVIERIQKSKLDQQYKELLIQFCDYLSKRSR